EMSVMGEAHFYRSEHTVPSGLLMAETVMSPTGQQMVEHPHDEIHVPFIKAFAKNLLWDNKEAALLDIGDGVVLYEFRSKGNTLSNKVVDGLSTVLDLLEENSYRGMVIGNASDHFCGGANLVEMGTAARAQDWDTIASLLTKFQALLQRIRYFHKPIVGAVQGRALGG
ncbi:MAG: enoyl-CoA hydratase/isomerase family protein, partial [Cyanobacteria bacterium J06642_12]